MSDWTTSQRDEVELGKRVADALAKENADKATSANDSTAKSGRGAR